MKCPAPLFVLCLALPVIAADPARAAADRAGPLRFSGREYVRLTGWGRANEFTIRWGDRESTLQLSNRTARLAFAINSRQARINGVEVWLSFPVVYRNGTAYISQFDLEKTLAPALSPPANRPGIRIKTICLDPGHGGKDPGFSVGSNDEKKYTLLLAQEARDQLKRAGFNVVLTRNRDAFVDLPARPELARKAAADIFVSLHFNAVVISQSQIKGVEVYCCTPAGVASTNARGEGDERRVTGNRNDEKNLLLACEMQKAILNAVPAEDRGVRRARFAVLRDASMPAVLVEAGYMSHPTEGNKISDPAYRRQLARGIVNGILAYRRAVKG